MRAAMKLRLFSPPVIAAPASELDLLATAVLMLDHRLAKRGGE